MSRLAQSVNATILAIAPDGFIQPERLSRPIVELGGDGIEMGLVVDREVRARGGSTGGADRS
jgi:hypothetical protein